MAIARIQKMDPTHLDKVLVIENASSLTPWSKEMFLEELRNPLAHAVVHGGDDARGLLVDGFLCFRNVGDESELLNLGVDPLYRRRGIARELMQFYVAFAQEKQIKTFFLEVHVSNLPAIQLYRGFSYQPAGMRKRFYKGQFDALVMVRSA